MKPYSQIVADCQFTYHILHSAENQLRLSTFNWVPKMENNQEDLLEKLGAPTWRIQIVRVHGTNWYKARVHAKY